MFESRSKKEKAKRRAFYNIIQNSMIPYYLNIEMRLIKDENKNIIVYATFGIDGENSGGKKLWKVSMGGQELEEVYSKEGC